MNIVTPYLFPCFSGGSGSERLLTPVFGRCAPVYRRCDCFALCECLCLCLYLCLFCCCAAAAAAAVAAVAAAASVSVSVCVCVCVCVLCVCPFFGWPDLPGESLGTKKQNKAQITQNMQSKQDS